MFVCDIVLHTGSGLDSGDVSRLRRCPRLGAPGQAYVCVPAQFISEQHVHSHSVWTQTHPTLWWRAKERAASGGAIDIIRLILLASNPVVF